MANDPPSLGIVEARLRYVSPEYHAAVRGAMQAEIESLRAVLVHIMLDVEDWEASTSLPAETLWRIAGRVKAKLHELPAESESTDPPTK